MRRLVPASALACAFAVLAFAPPAAARASLECHLSYTLSGWSVFYKTASGEGTVRCSNGQRLGVRLRTKGGGLTFGKTKITNGSGEFAGVHDIHDVLGAYANAEAHAGASSKSAGAVAMTKGEVSLALAGKGEGWNLGVAFGKFVLEAR